MPQFDFLHTRRALLENNPVGFEPDLNYPTAEFGDPLMPAYNAHLITTRARIGWTALEHVRPGAKRLYNPRLNEMYRDDPNLELAFFVAASGLAVPGQPPALLYSGDANELSPDEERVWESLVDLRLAEVNIDNDLPDTYRINAQQNL